MNVPSHPITPIFSGSGIELCTSPCQGKPFDTPDPGSPVRTVFVILAEVAVDHFVLVARDNHYIRAAPGHCSSHGIFVEDVNDTLLMAADTRYLTIALKPIDFAVWYQFHFDHEIEFWSMLSALAHARITQINRKDLVDMRMARLRKDFAPVCKPPEGLQKTHFMRNRNGGVGGR